MGSFPIPNEDFGRLDRRFNVRFRSTFFKGVSTVKASSKIHFRWSPQMVGTSKIFVWRAIKLVGTVAEFFVIDVQLTSSRDLDVYRVSMHVGECDGSPGSPGGAGSSGGAG